MEFKTKLLDEEERYSGIVRISKGAIRPGEYVVIYGRRRTVSKVWTKSCGENCIWIDEITAKNAGVSIGDSVRVYKIRPADAKEVILSGENLSDKVWMPRIISNSEEDLIKLVLKGRALSAGDVVAVKSPSTDFVVFYDVLKTKPYGFVVISNTTKINLL